MLRPGPIVGHCRKCGGGVAYQRHLATGKPKGPWLHLYEADWKDDPHNVDPDDAARAALAKAQGNDE